MGTPQLLSSLPKDLVDFLSGGRTCVVATVDADGHPDTTLMTWVVARDPDTLAICVDSRSRAFENLSVRRLVGIEVLGDDITWGLKGTATVEKDQLAAAPFPAALVRIRVDGAWDHSHPGTHFKGPSYVYADDKQHRLSFEKNIFDELLTG